MPAKPSQMLVVHPVNEVPVGLSALLPATFLGSIFVNVAASPQQTSLPGVAVNT